MGILVLNELHSMLYWRWGRGPAQLFCWWDKENNEMECQWGISNACKSLLYEGDCDCRISSTDNMRFKQHKTLSVSLCYHAGCLETRHSRNRRSGLWFWHCSCISNISTPKALCITLLLDIRYSQSLSYWGAFCVYNYTLFPYAYNEIPTHKNNCKKLEHQLIHMR